MLTTLANLKTTLGFTGTAKDAQYTLLLAAADQAVKSELGRDIEAASYTDYLSGNGTRYMVLRQTPVTAVTSVYINFSSYYGHDPDNPFDIPHLLTDGKDYVLDWDDAAGTRSLSGRLIRINYVWSEMNRSYTQGKVTQEVAPAIGNIKVVYTAGYTDVPADLQYAVCLVVSSMLNSLSKGGPYESGRLGEYAYKLAKQTTSVNMQNAGSLARILRQYKRTPW